MLTNLKQGTHCTGKTGEMEKKILPGKTQGIWKFCQNTGKTQGIWFAQVVNSLILKVKDILKLAVKFSKQNLSLISLPSHFFLCNSHKSRQFEQGKFAVGQRKNRENTGNLKMQIEWVPCKERGLLGGISCHIRSLSCMLQGHT